MKTADHLICKDIGLWWSEVPAYKNHRVGCLGGFQQITPEQLEECEEKLRQAGCTLAIGPMMGNTWRTHRAVIESNGSEPFLLEPFTPPALAQRFREAGYEELMTYSSSIIDLEKTAGDFSGIVARMAREKVVIRPLEMSDLENELCAIHQLSVEAFRENFLYVSISQEEFLTMYLKYAPILSPSCAFLAECEGRLAGFVFGYPQEKTIVVKTLAVLPERRFAGLGTLLVSTMQEAARKEGCEHAIHALQREDNQSLRISQRFSATVFRRYALFSKLL